MQSAPRSPRSHKFRPSAEDPLGNWRGGRNMSGGLGQTVLRLYSRFAKAGLKSGDASRNHLALHLKVERWNSRP